MENKKIKKKRTHKKPIHDSFFKECFSDTNHALELISLVTSPEEFGSLKKESIKQETSIYSKKGSEIRSDLIFSIETLEDLSPLKIVFLLEHKSTHSKHLFKQLLSYQHFIYSKMESQSLLERKTSFFHGKPKPKVCEGFGKGLTPILPIVVYHGDKPWTLPLSFHGYLGVDKKTLFGKSFLNYEYRLLDLRKLSYFKMPVSLTIRPFLYIMSYIRHLSDVVLKRFFSLCLGLDLESREKIYNLVSEYVPIYNEAFDLDRLSEMESKVFEKEDKIMPQVIYKTSQLFHQKGLEEGLEEGRREGLERTRQVVLNCLARDMDLKLISEITGLSVEEIREIQKEKKLQFVNNENE